eukprot:gnl/Spiro4/24048_TR11919_c0_g1_i1.p1 gnl/Spiro4/24048_TR11919_c0_g1~~gnl/Spiro4/24048_TR11919_c0_g1_i1.p1  ORF type:complete len:222 (+),score=30.76 gnl/Spiro4/24048_TR11919_c0_g1_i1:40-705(+)
MSSIKLLDSEDKDDFVRQLRSLDEKVRHEEILKLFVYPTTKKMREKPEDAVLQTSYSCDGSGKCVFMQARQDVKNSQDLHCWSARDVCTTIIEDIETHQNDHLPSQVDGFYINRMGRELVYLKREGATPSEKSSTGFIEYNDLRRRAADIQIVEWKASLFDKIVEMLPSPYVKPSSLFTLGCVFTSIMFGMGGLGFAGGRARGFFRKKEPPRNPTMKSPIR